jgi:hypothetical protein
LSGFVLALFVFGSGALTAVYLITAKPGPTRALDMETSSLWTNKVVRVDTASKDLTRVPARPVRQQENKGQNTTPDPGQLDATTTAAIQPPRSSQPAWNASHVAWCSQHYRSYDPADNSYNAYSGASRQCISPYFDGQSPAGDAAAVSNLEDAPSFVSAANAGGLSQPDFDQEHVRSCFDRYRSYRPEDNTYQPYGGGPRQQCL